MTVAEILITIAAVCAILIIVFVFVIFLEDRRRKRRKRNKRKAQKAVLAARRNSAPGKEDGGDRDNEENGTYGEELWGERVSCGEEELYGENELWGDRETYGEEELCGEKEPYEEEELFGNIELYEEEELHEEDGMTAGKSPNREEEKPDEEKGRTEEKNKTKEKGRTKEKDQTEEKDQIKEEKQDEEEAQNVINQLPEEEQAQREQFPVPIISVNDVTMKFRIATGSTSGLKDFIIQKIKKQISTRELIALDHVSFDVFKGEVVGIIGTNGSGKSTLLKIVSGALYPSEGNVTVDRKKVQMLSLGAGFDTELSARENVYLNGAIIGYSKEFINQNYDKIVEFAELEGFMDEKVKNFSSGMVSRLAFAIATVGDAAEILILDEVLSVGDEFFKKKSLARVKEMIHGGSTVLMVSHGISTILTNCTKVVWIEKGRLQMVGNTEIVCAAYRNKNS